MSKTFRRTVDGKEAKSVRKSTKSMVRSREQQRARKQTKGFLLTLWADSREDQSILARG